MKFDISWDSLHIPNVLVLFCEGLHASLRSSSGYRSNPDATYLEDDGSIAKKTMNSLYSVKRDAAGELHPVLNMLNGLKRRFLNCSPLVKTECSDDDLQFTVVPDFFIPAREITIGDFIWCGKAPSGNYPNWKQVIPADNALKTKSL